MAREYLNRMFSTNAYEIYTLAVYIFPFHRYLFSTTLMEEQRPINRS